MPRAAPRGAALNGGGPPGATMKRTVVGLLCAAVLLSQAAERAIEKEVVVRATLDEA